ncbi:MAG: DUF998 domain-containing protein [Rubrobacteraceae bacterium]|nr:DUF998 domain-containing protein [Rubrobacteraceae bacterium]
MIIMAAALAGMLGPVLFVTVILALTALQYDFMLEIGWRPLAEPADAWPSGLALGPYGLLQNANFVASGLLLALFATGLHLGVGDRRGLRAGPALLLLAGMAMALMGFERDPIRRVGPRSLHGLVHDAAFVLFILAMLAALFSLWRGFGKHLCWRGHARYTLATGMLAVLFLFLPGVAYYLFIVTLLTWIFVTAMRLWPPAINAPRRRSWI